MNSLKNLKSLQDLKLSDTGISTEILLRGLSSENKSTLTRLCLPESIFEAKDLEHLIESAPNLNHICVQLENEEELKVININSTFQKG